MSHRILFVSFALISACTTGGSRPARAFLTCATHADCPALEACEAEDTGMICRAHGGATGTGVGCALDGDCPVGEECEVEDTGSFCRYHGTDGGGTGAPCATHADCPASEECEIEHGVSSCRPHGGGDPTLGGTGAVCASDLDCPASEECEIEHGGSYCHPHGGGAEDTDAGVPGTGDGGTGTGALGATCASDLDCSAGLECEIEDTSSTCQPHSSGGGGV